MIKVKKNIKHKKEVNEVFKYLFLIINIVLLYPCFLVYSYIYISNIYIVLGTILLLTSSLCFTCRNLDIKSSKYIEILNKEKEVENLIEEVIEKDFNKSNELIISNSNIKSEIINEYKVLKKK